jgi:hypothetical protein
LLIQQVAKLKRGRIRAAPRLQKKGHDLHGLSG